MSLEFAGSAGRLRDRGYSYVMVLVAIVIIGIMVEVANIATAGIIQGEREAELLFRGQAYRKAIESYYRKHGMFPRTLEDLVRDAGSAQRRHLRKLYADPMAKGEAKDWILVRAADGGIAGVASSSKTEPRKKANFSAGLEKFAAAKAYSDWVFEYTPKTVAHTPSAVANPPMAQPPVLRTN